LNYLSKTYTFTKTIPKAVGVEGGVWAMGVRGLKGWGDGFCNYRCLPGAREKPIKKRALKQII